MKRGFTLIELLAVIVILAIIALIATPIVLNIVDSSKKQSNERSKELYLEAVKEAIIRKNLTSEFNPTNCTVNKDGNIACDGEELTIEITGKKPCKGTIVYENGKILSENIGYCDVLYKDKSQANYPDLMNNTLTPVIYKDDFWQVADTSEKWYDYNDQWWANAVILKDGVSKNIGTKLKVPAKQEDITSSDILAMFVWIPKYEYKIDTTNGQFGKGSNDKTVPGEIEVNFINKGVTYENTNEKGYRIHPAFTFGDEILSGIWVGKFETSHTSGNYDLSCIDENCIDANNIRILPNVTSLRNNTVSKFFFVSRSMSREGNLFKINKNEIDTHMMKGSEWGAVAYLSQSKYGKYGNNLYTGSNKEIYINNSREYNTGTSGGAPGGKASNSCKYDDLLDMGSGTGFCGGGASTTGNIYGIYDMSGGSYEYLMANYNNTVVNSGFETLPDDLKSSKYYDLFTDTSVDSACNKAICYGFGLSETRGWYGDNPAFLSQAAPWLLRDDANSRFAGVFSSYPFSGAKDSRLSFRIVIL